MSVLWVGFGFSLAFGDDIGGVLGDPTTFLMFQHVGADTYITPTGKLLGGATIPLALYALFQMKFAIITPSLITGSFAERVRFSAYLFFMMWFMVFIYCPLAHMTWHPDGLFLKWAEGLPRRASRSLPTSPLYCWEQPCCGWDGSASMQAVRCMPTARQSRRFSIPIQPRLQR